MIRRLFPLLAILLAHPVLAQTSEAPILEVTFEQSEAIPGEMLNLRLTVLVPTFMPKPPVWPPLETPNLLVRLPAGATGPTSRRIDGETGSGVTRRYRISPMIPGRFALLPQDVVVTYADPETSKPVEAVLRTGPITFSGIIPAGAEGLDPFIAADRLALTETLDGNPAAMKPGDSVVRTVTATIEGVSPMFLPRLLPEVAIDGIAAYPAEPTVAERDNRGEIGGSRTEQVTLVAEGGGSGDVPPVTLDWYNLRTGTIERAAVEGFAVTVDGPPLKSSEPRDWRAILTVAGAGLVALVLLAWLVRRVTPPALRFVRERWTTWLASEVRAYAALRRTIRRRDYTGLHPALDSWAAKVAPPDPRKDPRLVEALTRLGAGRYGNGRAGAPSDAWRALGQAVADARHARRATTAGGDALPPLNPGTEPVPRP